MKSFITTSAPNPNTQGQSVQPQWIFFNSKSVSNTSHTFEVNDQPVYLEGYNFSEDDTVTVKMVSSTGLTEDYKPIRGTVQLTIDRTKVRIDYPGVYQLVFSGDNVANVTVLGYPGTMSHESISELAAAIDFIVSQGAGGAGADQQVIYNKAGKWASSQYLKFDDSQNKLTLGKYGAGAIGKFVLNGSFTGQVINGISLTAPTEIAVSDFTYMEVTPTGSGAIGSLQPAINLITPPSEDFQAVFILNAGAIACPVKDNWAGASDAKYKIDCGGSDGSIPAKRGCWFVYSVGLQRWHMGAY